MTEQEINQFNLTMRSQPWYQEFFRSRGLNPNQVHLTDQQRAELSQEAAKNGAPLPKNLIIDPAGNLNQHGGWAGQPTWLKALEIGAPLAVTGFGLAGMGPLGGAIGLGGGSAATTGAAAGAAGASGAGAAGTGALGAGAATGAGVGLPTLTGATSIGSGMAAAGPTSILGATGAGAAGGAGSTIGGLLSKIPGSPDAWDSLSKATGAITTGEAVNRYEKGRQTQGYDRLMLDAAQNRRTDESDALKKLAQTKYLESGGSQFKPPSIMLNGTMHQTPDLGYGPTPASDAQKQGASTLEQQMLARLQPGGSYTPTTPDYLNRGALENVGQYGGLITGGISAAKNLFGLPDLSKIILHSK